MRVLGEGPQGFPWGHPRDVAGTKTDATEPPWDPHGDPGGSQASHRGRKTAASSAQRAPKGSIGPKDPRGAPRAHICAISTRRRVQRVQGAGRPNGARAQIGDPRAWYPLPRNRSQRKHKLQQIHFLRLNRCGIFYVINPSGANTVLANFPLRREQSLFRNAELQGYSSTRNKNNAASYHVRTGGPRCRK